MERGLEEIIVQLDVSATATPDYKELCHTNVDESMNEEEDSWFDSCSKFMNNVVTGLDPTWSVTHKFDKSDPVAQMIMSKKYKTGADRTSKARIINLLDNVQVDFITTLTGINYTFDNAVVELAFDMKIYKGSTFVESVYTPSI